MAATVATVAYLGLEARAVEVQVQLTSGVPKFTIVGLADKAVAESRERVRAALAAIGLALPPSACSQRSVRRTRKRCRTMSRWVSCAWTGGSRPRRAFCLPRFTRRAATRD